MAYRSIEPRLPVHDLPASIDFDCGRLGLVLESVWPEGAPEFAVLSAGPVRLQLLRSSQTVARGTFSVWLECDDALALHGRLSAGYPIEWGPEVYWYGCREFAILDPDGHRVIFSQPTGEPPTCRDE